jgi:DHA1 family multidrug resistance protein-like MFS transporter
MTPRAGQPLDWRRNLLFIAVAQFFSIAGFGFSLPFIPFYIRDHLQITSEAERSLWVGLFAASGHLALFLFAPFWGFVADIYGRRTMLLRANFCSAILLPLAILMPNVLWLVILRFLIGIFAGTVTASQTLVASNTPSDKMGFAMGMISSAVGSGHLAGFLFGALVVDHFGYTVGFAASGAMLALAGFLVLFGSRENFVRTTSLRQSTLGLHLSLPHFGGVWLLLGLMSVTAFVSAFERPFVPQMTELIVGHGSAKFWTSIVLGGSAIAGIVAGALMGRLADRTSPARVGMWSSVLAGAAAIPLALSWGIGMMIGARMLMAFFAAGLDPVFQIWLARSAPSDKRALFLGWGTSFRALGWFICAATAGGVAMLGGVRMVFMVTAGLFFLLAPFILATSRRLTAVSAVARGA